MKEMLIRTGNEVVFVVCLNDIKRLTQEIRVSGHNGCVSRLGRRIVCTRSRPARTDFEYREQQEQTLQQEQRDARKS